MEVAGAQRVLLSQARWFQNTGYPVQAVFFYDKQALKDEWQREKAFPIIPLEARKLNADPVSNTLRLLRALLRLYRILRNDIKVIVTFTPHSNVLGLPVAWLAGVPVRIGTHHGYIEGSSKFLAWFHGRLTNSRICSAMVAVSAQVRNDAVRREGAKPKRISVIENGVESTGRASKNSNSRECIRKELSIGTEDLLFLTVGRLTVQKGHTYLLEAISRVVSNYPKTYFVFAGDGPLRIGLQEKAQALGVSNKIAFLGIRNDIGELLSASDVFVQPSLWEGLSLALLEALMAGLPVLATRVEGVVDVVEHGKSALLVSPKDAEDLAAALEQLITDDSLRERLSRFGQARAKKSYSIDTMCRSYEELIIKLLPNVP